MTLPIRLKVMLPRAAALTVASQHRHTESGRQRIRAVFENLTTEQIQDLAVTLALFTDANTLMGESLGDPLEPLDLAIAAAARRFELDVKDLSSTSRKQEVVEARQVAAYIAHRLFKISSPQVGRALNRDHSTILFSVARVGETPRLRRIALDIAQRIGWTRPGEEDEAS